MMLRLFLVATILATAPTFVSAHGACAHGEQPATALGPLYVTAGSEVWQESNGHPGLQTAGGSCEDENGRTQRWSADTRIL